MRVCLGPVDVKRMVSLAVAVLDLPTSTTRRGASSSVMVYLGDELMSYHMTCRRVPSMAKGGWRGVIIAANRSYEKLMLSKPSAQTAKEGHTSLGIPCL